MAFDPHLDERDLEILQLLWEHGPQKPAELQSRFSHKMKNSALSNVLFGGSALAMIGELVDVQRLTPEDIEHLRKIARSKGRTGPGKSRRKA
jgi:predicted transcriptional regulator